jgi:hypothetical protein
MLQILKPVFDTVTASPTTGIDKVFETDYDVRDYGMYAGTASVEKCRKHFGFY